MLLVTDVEYTLQDKDLSKAKLEVLVQTTLSGGTATFSVRDKDSSAFSLVKSLTDVPELLRVPYQGFFKVTLTGSAVAYGDFT
tara:strand:- start:495 stop:743 length:249 start_codon:yes stop_codon:yes gene_type:complete